MSVTDQRDAVRHAARTPLQRDFSDYRAILTRYWQHYDRSQTCILFHDDIVADPMTLLRAVCDHVGLDFKERYFDSLEQSVNRSPRIERDEDLLDEIREDYMELLHWLHLEFGSYATTWYEEAKTVLAARRG